MDSDIFLEKTKYWNELISCNHHSFINQFHPFYANLQNNKEFHEHLGLEYITDQYETINGNRKILYMFKVTSKNKYLLAKIKYGF
jgi:hypothetical protein